MDHIRRVFCCLCVSLLAACGGGGGSSAPPATVTVTPPMASVMVGQQIQLAASTNATGSVMWSSSNGTVATVNSTGLVMGLSLGQVTITAISGGVNSTAALTITTGITFNFISTGNNHTCGLAINGVAYCWGDNRAGQLGNGTTTNSATPVPVTGPSGAGQLGFVTSVIAGGDHTCATALGLGIGTAYCWGDNSSGELGNGTTTNSSIPVPVLITFQEKYLAVSAGAHHTCGLVGSLKINLGIINCWGDNTYGQLGNGTMTSSTTPVPVANVNGIMWDYVSAGSTHTCALYEPNNDDTSSTAVYCWGDNSAGQFGDNTTISSVVPVQVFIGPFAPYPSFSAGTLYTCITNPGSPDPALCSGLNTFGQLGNGTTTNSSSLVAVNAPNAFDLGISTGADHACGAAGVGSAYCWGNNNLGQLGNGTTTNSATPIAVAGGLSFVVVSAGGHHTCGIISGSVPLGPTAPFAVYCWGDNTYGQLGNAWTTTSSVPVNVAGSP
jgi:alpha-tubulin suppressor-like RCC1 family protein